MYLGIFSKNDTIHFKANTVDQNGSAVDATTGPTFEVFKLSSDSSLSSGSMTKITNKTGFYTGNFECEGSSFKPGQYFIRITATVDGQTPSTFVTFQLVSDNQSLEETTANIRTLISSFGDGSVSIDHNYGGKDSYRILSAGTPVANVTVRAFVKSDYDAGRKNNQYVVAETTTNSEGRWKEPIRLDPGTYTLQFSKKSAFKIQIITLEVS